MIRVTVKREGEPAEQLTVQGEITIGCVTGRDILLDDPQISRLHAVVREENGDCIVVDRESLNGTVIGGYPVVANEPTPWRPGEAMVIRGYTLVYGPPEEGRDPALEVESEPIVEFLPGFEVRRSSAAEHPRPGLLRTELLRQPPSNSRWDCGTTTLVVLDLYQETRDAWTLRLGDGPHQGAAQEPFLFEPGQFVGLVLEVDGQRVVRWCGISSSPSRPLLLDVTVQRAPGETDATWPPGQLRIGDRVETRAPAGEFSLFRYPSEKVLLLAGGSGMVPLMSMLRWIVDVSAPVDVVVLYSARTTEDVIFARELESIAARFPRVAITVTTTSQRMPTHGWLGLRGRIDRPKLEAAVPDLAEREAYVCGSVPFVTAMGEHLLELGLPEERLHQQRAL
ncbi:NADH oxidoreductase hcr [Planctomycetes bacterium Poly30]|uniref:NADH oxidoreductase hcr n=1 Tax=Saltatorellus ferox TaxID=2528018 RepID=A0A518EKF6_9BACT|nr:NADH oxidoreductase hcr [Planctomycetes bacterium Poly30]